jgi:ABC-2 type transport system permease protein
MVMHAWRALMGIMGREGLRFIHQRERFISALVRPLL